MVSQETFSSPIDWLQDILNQLKQKVAELLETIKTKLDGLLSFLSATFRPILDSIRNSLSSIASAITSFLNQFATKVKAALSDLVETLTELPEKIGKKLDKLFERIVYTLENVVYIIKQKLIAFAQDIREWLKKALAYIEEKFDAFLEKLKGSIAGLASGIKESLDSAIAKVRDWGENVIENIAARLARVRTDIEEKFNTMIATAREWLYNRIIEIGIKVKALWDNVSAKIREVWAKILIFISEWLGRATEAAQTLMQIGSLVWGRVAAGDYSGAFKLVDDILAGLGLPRPIAVVRSIISCIAYFYLTVQLQFVPMQMMTQVRATESIRPSGIGVETAALGVHLGFIDEGTFWANAARMGIPDNVAKAAFATLRKFPTPDEVGAAYIRGEISQEEHDNVLRLMGFDDRSIAIKKMLYWTIPTPSDLIRMAVRECFSPEIAEKFGQYEDLPQEFVEWANKVGLSEFWAKAYWAAHWDLPSPQMGFEMLHRQIINEEELKLLLRALDVMPFWRDKLIQLSYNPYTRVDVRRMYQMGILDEEGVYRTYRDLGYDHEHALNLTEFTKRYYSPEDYSELDKYKEVTQGLLIKAYKRGVLSRDDLRSRLIELGYHPDDAELIIAIADVEISLEGGESPTAKIIGKADDNILRAYSDRILSEDDARRALIEIGKTPAEADAYIALADYESWYDTLRGVVEIAHRKYVERTWSKEETTTFLAELNLRGETINSILQLWDLDRLATVRKPTEAQFRAALQRGIITPEEYKEELRGMGFDEKYVQMLAKLAGVKE